MQMTSRLITTKRLTTCFISTPVISDLTVTHYKLIAIYHVCNLLTINTAPLGKLHLRVVSIRISVTLPRISQIDVGCERFAHSRGPRDTSDLGRVRSYVKSRVWIVT